MFKALSNTYLGLCSSRLANSRFLSLYFFHYLIRNSGREFFTAFSLAILQTKTTSKLVYSPNSTCICGGRKLLNLFPAPTRWSGKDYDPITLLLLIFDSFIKVYKTFTLGGSNFTFKQLSIKSASYFFYLKPIFVCFRLKNTTNNYLNGDLSSSIHFSCYHSKLFPTL